MQSDFLTTPLPKPKRGGFRKPGSADQQAAELLAVKAYELRLQGFSYRQIAEQLGYADKTGAHDAVQRAQKACVTEKREELRELELSRLDHSLTKLAPAIERGEVPAILAGLKIMERRAKLAGLDIQAETHPEDVKRRVTDVAKAIYEQFKSEGKSESDATELAKIGVQSAFDGVEFQAEWVN